MYDQMSNSKCKTMESETD